MPTHIHPSHLPTLKMLEANIRRAISDGQTVSMGGGKFLPSELCSLLMSVVHSIKSIEGK